MVNVSLMLIKCFNKFKLILRLISRMFYRIIEILEKFGSI